MSISVKMLVIRTSTKEEDVLGHSYAGSRHFQVRHRHHRRRRPRRRVIGPSRDTVLEITQAETLLKELVKDFMPHFRYDGGIIPQRTIDNLCRKAGDSEKSEQIRMVCTDLNRLHGGSRASVGPKRHKGTYRNQPRHLRPSGAPA